MKPTVCFFWGGVLICWNRGLSASLGGCRFSQQLESGVRKVRTGRVLGPCRGQEQGSGPPPPTPEVLHVCAQHCARRAYPPSLLPSC